jgi:hypothetical protein
MQRSDLLELVYRFYPRGMSPRGIGYEDTDERFRQLEAARRGIDDYPRWKAMLRRLGERYPIRDWSIYLLEEWWGPAYSEAARDIAREIEATYPGHPPIPPELGDVVVPDVCVDGARLGGATIHHCLFSAVWGWGSPRRPPCPPPIAPAPVRGGRWMEFTISPERHEGGEDPDDRR